VNRLERHIERDLRQIADRAAPSPNAWNSILTRIANQAPDTETEIIMLTETNPTTTRRWLPFAAAAAVIAILVAGIAFTVNRGSDDDQDPSPAATTVAPTTVAPTTVAPTTVTGFFAGGDGVSVTFDKPNGWAVFQGWLVSTSGAGLAFWDLRNIYAEGCQWVLVDPPIGPTVDDLVAALTNVPAYAATAPVDVTVDGYVGKKIEFTVPDYNKDECKVKSGSGVYGLWQEDNDEDDSAGPQFWAQGSRMHNTLYILDVNGTRLVIDVYTLPDASPQDLAALDEVVASVQIG
jgi:hypothetical protein